MRVEKGWRQLGMWAALAGAGISSTASAGSFDLFGIETNYRLTLGYAVGMRMEEQDPNLIDGPIDQMIIAFDPISGSIGAFTHTGLPITTNFDDGNRDFKKGSLTNHRVSGYGEVEFRLDNLGLGNIAAVASGAAHYDQVFLDKNDHDNPDSVNRISLDSNLDRVGPVNEWSEPAKETNGRRHRLLEAYVSGEWYLTDSMALNLRAGKHLAAWGESLFFPGIVAAQGPFDATKALVPGAEVKEILLPVNQVSMQLALMQDLTLLAYNQFEYKPTEVFPQGDFFSPADLVGPGGVFGYGSINPMHPDHCSEPTVFDATTGAPVPAGTLCIAGEAFANEPEYIMVTRTPDNVPDAAGQWGVGLKYQLLSNLSVGGYYLRFHNHNPNVALNMGYARVGDDVATGTPVTTESFGVRVPVSYTVGYADDIEMYAASFSTVVWVFNVAGEVIHRVNTDTSLEAIIAGVASPWGTRGETTQAQMSLLYVVNPDFLMFDEVVVVAEAAYLQVDDVDPVANQDGVCMSGTSDCSDFTEEGNQLFYDERSWALQVQTLPKGRNVFAGWDIGTPISFQWLASGTPSQAGAFGALYGEGDMRAGLSVTAQYLQNLEFALGYNALFGDSEKKIGNSDLLANPFADHDYATFTVKYNL